MINIIDFRCYPSRLVIIIRYHLQFSDDETDDKRVVRTAKEKRYEVLFSIIKTIRNSKKIKDFNKMLSR